MTRTITFILLLTLVISACRSNKQSAHTTEGLFTTLSPLRVSENGRYLQKDDGTPFFWLGDTGWLLLKRLNRDEAAEYLTNRQEKGFNVVQTMVIHDLKNCDNALGDSAVSDFNIARPLLTEGSDPADTLAYDFWDHLDYVVDLAAEKGIYMALVPIWGSNVKANPLTPDQASAYGAFLAKRYGDRNNIIWLNGGDTRGSDSTAFWLALGKALKTHAPAQLMTFHPFGRMRSADWFHHEDWLDFNMFQSGHRRYDQDDTERCFGEDNWRYIEADYALEPARPTLDGEPSYEHIPQGLHDTTEPLWDDADLRRYAYWSVFAGGCGFTYGHNEIMQFFRPGLDDPAYGAHIHWREAMEAPGAAQMQHLRSLIESRSPEKRLPDPSLIAGENGSRYDHIVACRGLDYAYLYSYTGRTMEVQTGILEGSALKASWYDPRKGSYSDAGRFDNQGTLAFDPPGDPAPGNDWVLVLESEN